MDYLLSKAVKNSKISEIGNKVKRHDHFGIINFTIE